MSSAQSTEGEVRVGVRNVGGIDETAVSFSPGVTVLVGRNATNRTSFLQALMAALGSDGVSLKGDADSGEVSLSLGGGTYTRELERVDGGVATGGDPYLEDPTLGDLFAFLLETNEARQAVARGEDLRDIIMRPVDTDAIRAEIEQYEARKRTLDERLEDLERRSRRLPDLEQRHNTLEARIAEKRDELESLREDIDAADADVGESQAATDRLEADLADLGEARSSLEEIRYRLETERDSLASLREERRGLEAKLSDLPATGESGVEDLEAELERLRDHKRTLESTITRLQRIIQFNEDLLDGAGSAPVEALAPAGDDPASGLLPGGEQVVCWTCGSEVERSAIEDTRDRLQDLRQETVAERTDVATELEDLRAEREEREERVRERERAEERLERVEAEIAERESTVEDLEERREAERERIDRLEAAVAERERKEYSEVLELHREANDLEFELRTLEDEREEVAGEMADLRDDLADRDRLEAERAEVTEALEELRTRIDRLEAAAVEGFNEHAAELLDVLGYGNLERIWIERMETAVEEGRRTVDRRQFDLHVVRSTESGATYEDTVDHLSESEREVAGLVFALAGYLAHDVHETVPFMLLDSLEAIDSERIAALVDYFADYATHLVVALLPEDAAALDDAYERVESI